jgi:RNA polymerase sigma-70 factor (ECF subfamily)
MIDENIKSTIAGLKNRDLKIFEELFFNYHGRLVLFANKFVGDMQVSRDLVQDAFVILWDKADELDIKTSPKAYLYQAIKNSCLNYNRHLNIVQNAESNLALKIAELEKEVYQDSSSPYFSLIEMELEEKIAEVIESMPDKCKEVFKLSRFEHLKNKEIAEKLGISVKMVEKHISKALIILRRDLAEYIGILLCAFISRF